MRQIEAAALLVAQHHSGLWLARGGTLFRIVETSVAAVVLHVATVAVTARWRRRLAWAVACAAVATTAAQLSVPRGPTAVGQQPDILLLTVDTPRADHGEELGRVVHGPKGPLEPYFGHSIYLFDSSLRVPLCLRPPAGNGLEPRRERRIVTTTALATTILRTAGVEVPDGLSEPLPTAPTDPRPAIALSLAHYGDNRVERISARIDGWRLVETRLPHRDLLLLRHEGDAEEERDPDDHPEVVGDLLSRLHLWQPSGQLSDAHDPDTISGRERDYLRALGYLE